MNKTFKFEIKEFGGEGSFVGLASVYGNKDLGGDVVEAGAFNKSIQEKGGEVPILWQHDMREPIGLGKLTDTADGLLIKGELALESPVAVKAYGLLKRGVLKGLSIGYDTIRDEVKDKVRYLKELKLWEVSIVTFPMNELATVSAVKSDVEMLARIDALERIVKLLAPEGLHAGQPPADQRAAAQDKDAPEILHPSLDRIQQLLQGEI